MTSSQIRNGGRHAVERSHRAPAEAARLARPHDRRAGWYHGEGGATSKYHPAKHFEIDRGPGACARACACSTVTVRGSRRPSTVVRYSIAERPYSMTCARESRRSSFSPTLGLGRCGSEAAPLLPKTSFLPSS